MPAAVRRWLVTGALGVVAVLLALATVGLPSFGDFTGPYTRNLLDHAVAERHATNVVMAVTFDYRGFDTLGEEFILFSAVSGVALLLRASRETSEWERPVDRQPVETLTGVGLVLTPLLIVVGLWLVGHGHLTPGGGFQGGVVLAMGAVLLYLTAQYRAFRRITPEHVVDAAEGIGAGTYVIFGFAGLVIGGSFLFNFLPLGRTGLIDSSGTIAVINAFVGLEVAAAFVLLVTEFAEEATLARAGEEADTK